MTGKTCKSTGGRRGTQLLLAGPTRLATVFGPSTASTFQWRMPRQRLEGHVLKRLGAQEYAPEWLMLFLYRGSSLVIVRGSCLVIAPHWPFIYPMLCFIQMNHTTVLYPPPYPLLAWNLTYAFLPSSTQNTVLATAMRCSKSDKNRASVWNTCCNGGK